MIQAFQSKLSNKLRNLTKLLIDWMILDFLYEKNTLHILIN